MKVDSFSLALVSLNACLFAPSTVEALKCGSAITKDCFADQDVRYDADASNNLVDQADIWKTLPGLYISDAYFYNSTGEPMKQDQFGFEWFPAKAFKNITVDGSRYYIHTYYVVRNAFTGFAAGATGALITADAWYTSTFERDGSAQELATKTALDNNPVFISKPSNQKLNPVNDRTIYGSGESSTAGLFLQSSITCVDEDCTAILDSGEAFGMDDNVQPLLINFNRNLNSKKVGKKEFISTMITIFDDYSVPLHDTTSVVKRPRDVSTAECASGVCPSEEDWQTIDPNFNKSPYQEPDASLTAGFIAGIVIASFVIVAFIAYMYHRHIVKEREQRMKTAFARAVAATIDKRTTAQNLSPEDLKNEFDSIDTDNDGTVSKDELRSFISDSNVAEIDDKDFDVLFATIDLDGNSSLDFSEFCSFFAYVCGEFDTAIENKSVRNMRKSTMNLNA